MLLIERNPLGFPYALPFLDKERSDARPHIP